MAAGLIGLIRSRSCTGRGGVGIRAQLVSQRAQLRGGVLQAIQNARDGLFKGVGDAGDGLARLLDLGLTFLVGVKQLARLDVGGFGFRDRLIGVSQRLGDRLGQPQQNGRLRDDDNGVEQHAQYVSSAREDCGGQDEVQTQMVNRGDPCGRHQRPPVAHERDHRQRGEEGHVHVDLPGLAAHHVGEHGGKPDHAGADDHAAGGLARRSLPHKGGHPCDQAQHDSAKYGLPGVQEDGLQQIERDGGELDADQDHHGFGLQLLETGHVREFPHSGIQVPSSRPE